MLNKRIIINSFFREVTVINREHVPLYGPVIFVGNHNNQFVDASVLIATLPRKISFLIAEKSLNRTVIGFLARKAGSIAVSRTQDETFQGHGSILLDCDDDFVHGIDTKFSLELKINDKIRIAATNQIITVVKIISDILVEGNEKVQLESDQSQLMNSADGSSNSNTGAYKTTSTYSIIPKIDQSKAYKASSETLVNGNCIGIFPEGGSHDRLELLPLKPGVAHMALTASNEGAEDILIVPIGLTYYEATKLFSRAIIHIGTPLTVPVNIIENYRTNPKEAVSMLMTKIEENIKKCIVSVPNYQALKAVRLCVTLYTPESLHLPTNKYHMLYHQFSLLFAKHRNHPINIECSEAIAKYHRYGIADHEVLQLKLSVDSAFLSLFNLFIALIYTCILGILFLPFWGPILSISSYIAEKNRCIALANSKVKITGQDVVASYKILTLIVLVPSANLLYLALYTWLYSRSIGEISFVILSGLIVLPIIYYCNLSLIISTHLFVSVSIRHYYKIGPLLRKFKYMFLIIVCKLSNWRDNEKHIISHRMNMQLLVRKMVQQLGPETTESFMEEMERCIPEVVCTTDSNRIHRKLSNHKNIVISATFLPCRFR